MELPPMNSLHRLLCKMRVMKWPPLQMSKADWEACRQMDEAMGIAPSRLAKPTYRQFGMANGLMSHEEAMRARRRRPKR